MEWLNKSNKIKPFLNLAVLVSHVVALNKPVFWKYWCDNKHNILICYYYWLYFEYIKSDLYTHNNPVSLTFFWFKGLESQLLSICRKWLARAGSQNPWASMSRAQDISASPGGPGIVELDIQEDSVLFNLNKSLNILNEDNVLYSKFYSPTKTKELLQWETRHFDETDLHKMSNFHDNITCMDFGILLASVFH